MSRTAGRRMLYALDLGTSKADKMAREPDIESGASFCGNCGTPVDPGERSCRNCGIPTGGAALGAWSAQGTGGTAPADYIPYCRSCGVVVNWGDGHFCSRCGIAPLCRLHFRAQERLCLDCAGAPAPSRTATSREGLRCGSCGASVAPFTEFCPNCGRAVSARQASGEYVGFWIRAGAFVVDWIITYVASVIIAMLIGIPLISGDPDFASNDDIAIIVENFNYRFLFVFCGLYTVYGMLMTALRGQTLGKMLLRIQVVEASGNIPPWPRVMLRELIRGVISVALFPLGLLYLWVVLDARRRGFHDYIGGSYVVRKGREARPPGG